MSAAFEEVERAFHAVMAAREQNAGQCDEQQMLELCGGNVSVLAEVRSLLHHYQIAGETADGDTISPAASGSSQRFLDPAELHDQRKIDVLAAHQLMLDEWGASLAGQRVDEFTLIGERGAGAMGVVFLAEQEQPRRTVALKLVRRHAATASMIRRFDREAQLLARLNHPGVAQVYAAGVAGLMTEAGAMVRVPYIAMELVDGPNLLDYVRAHGSDSSLILRLIAQVCDAVQHAHVRGVIHRDLKPSNILVATDAEQNPQVKVLDFGVARPRGDDGTSAHDQLLTEFTDHGQIVGTLSYMSPEQVRSGSDVDARTDVYAIGAILYQLFASRLPIDVRNCPLPEAARRIAEYEPPLLGSIRAELRGDIETIASTALQKEPSRRYQSPAELARDIRHHLAGEPIQARRDSLLYVFGRQAARYRSFAYAAAALLLVVAIAAIYSFMQHRRSIAAAHVAQIAQARATAAQNQAEHAAARLATELSASRIDHGQLLGATGDLEAAERLLWDEYFANPLNRSAYCALWQLYSKSGCLRTIRVHRGECWTMALAPDGQSFATGGDEPVVRIWSVPDAKLLAELQTPLTTIYAIDFSPDGRRLAAAGEGGAVIVTQADASILWLGQGNAAARGIDIASNGQVVSVGSEDGWVRVYEATSGNELCAVEPKTVGGAAAPAARGVRFDPASRHLAAAYVDGTVGLWKATFSADSLTLAPGAHIAGRPGTTGYNVDFSPDGTILASGSSDRTMSFWRVADGLPLRVIETNNGSARAAAFSPDGECVAIPGFWRTQLYSVATGDSALPANLPSLGWGSAHAAAFTPDMRILITTGPAGTCRLWDLIADPTTVLRSTRAPIRDLAVLVHGEQCLIASIQSDGRLMLRTRPLHASTQSDGWRVSLQCDVGKRSQTLAASPDARRIVIGRSDGHVITVRGDDGRIIQDLSAHSDSVNCVRLAHNGQFLITGGSDDVVRIWQWQDSGWILAREMAVSGDVVGVAIHPDSATFATTSRPAHLQLWDLASGRRLHQETLDEMPWRLAYSADGKRIAAGSWDRSVHVWEFTSTTQPSLFSTLVGHSQLVMNEAFAESSDLLASVSMDGSLRVWDLGAINPDHAARQLLNRRRCLLALDAGAGDSMAVAFLPRAASGAQFIVVGYFDGSLRIWDLGYFQHHLGGQIEYQRSLRPDSSTQSVTPVSRPIVQIHETELR